MLLREQPPVVVPVLAVLSSSSDMRNRENPALFQKRLPRRTKCRIVGDAVSSISVQPCRMRTIHCDSVLMDDGQRHHRSVRTLRFHFFRFNLRKIHWGWRHDMRILNGPIGAERIPQRGLSPTGEFEPGTFLDWV